MSGLTAAYLLQRTHEVTLFEAEGRLGGHAHTHDVATSGGTVPVDSGFIVLNDRTYPHVRRLFAELGVATRPTEMSMSITCDGCGLSYAGGRGASGVFAQRHRVVDRRFWRLLGAIRRFQRLALAHLDHGEEMSYGEFLRRHEFADDFIAHYALPVVSCVWSMGYDESLAYPAGYLFAFLRHHGFLTLGDSPTWHTVVGGSRTYVEAIASRLDAVHVSSPVTSLARTETGVELTDGLGARRTFDKAVVATHADQALHLLADATPREKELLGAFGYSVNRTYLHRDDSTLPPVAMSRSSWNYRLDTCDVRAENTRVTYWMNRLQHLPESDPLLVTLNPDRRPDAVVAEMDYTHPTYTAESVAAQAKLPELNTERVAFAGAYHGWGFHEDGCRSGVAAAAALGATW